MARAPLSALSIVVAADPMGVLSMLKEMRGGSKALKAARKERDWPPVVRELIDHLDEHSRELSEGIAPAEGEDDPGPAARAGLAESAAAAQGLTAAELAAYVRWVVGIGRGAAEANKEGGSGDPVSASEAAALSEIEQTLRAG